MIGAKCCRCCNLETEFEAKKRIASAPRCNSRRVASCCPEGINTIPIPANSSPATAASGCAPVWCHCDAWRCPIPAHATIDSCAVGKPSQIRPSFVTALERRHQGQSYKTGGSARARRRTNIKGVPSNGARAPAPVGTGQPKAQAKSPQNPPNTISSASTLVTPTTMTCEPFERSM